MHELPWEREFDSISWLSWGQMGSSGEGMGVENMKEWDGQVEGGMEWKSSEKKYLDGRNHYGVREKPGAREIPRKLQG